MEISDKISERHEKGDFDSVLFFEHSRNFLEGKKVFGYQNFSEQIKEENKITSNNLLYDINNSRIEKVIVHTSYGEYLVRGSSSLDQIDDFNQDRIKEIGYFFS